MSIIPVVGCFLWVWFVFHVLACWVISPERVVGVWWVVFLRVCISFVLGFGACFEFYFFRCLPELFVFSWVSYGIRFFFFCQSTA